MLQEIQDGLKKQTLACRDLLRHLQKCAGLSVTKFLCLASFNSRSSIILIVSAKLEILFLYSQDIIIIVSVKILLAGHFSNFTWHNLLTDKIFKKRTDLERCLVIMYDHNVKLALHFQNLVGQCPLSDCYNCNTALWLWVFVECLLQGMH